MALSELLHPTPPRRLVELCEGALALDPADRHSDASTLAEGLSAYLKKQADRARALGVLQRAQALGPEIDSLRARAEELRQQAAELLEPLAPHDPVAKKMPGWAKEEEAAEIDRTVATLGAERLSILQTARTIAPDLDAAAELLADHYKDELLTAETKQDAAAVLQAETLLRSYDRGRHSRLLEGKGALSLVTDPPGAELHLYRFVEVERRLVPEFVGMVGRTPVHRLEVPKGSLLVVIRHPDCQEVRYPALIERAGHWQGLRPGSDAPHVIHLPQKGELGENDIYVPAGWCLVGGDEQAGDSLPGMRIWVDAFVVSRFPVTCGEYLSFLNALEQAGRSTDVEAAMPRFRGSAGTDHPLGRGVFDRDAAGRFCLPSSSVQSSGQWSDDHPIVLIDAHAADLYARWRGSVDGLPWRLPNELEWEKAARSVDGRLYPWGNHIDPTWVRVINATAEPPQLASVQAFPIDESPYGLRGAGGNVRELCCNAWTRQGPVRAGEPLRAHPDAPGDALRSVRGGAWSGTPNQSRGAARFAAKPDLFLKTMGFRLARSYESVK